MVGSLVVQVPSRYSPRLNKEDNDRSFINLHRVQATAKHATSPPMCESQIDASPTYLFGTMILINPSHDRKYTRFEPSISECCSPIVLMPIFLIKPTAFGSASSCRFYIPFGGHVMLHREIALCQHPDDVFRSSTQKIFNPALPSSPAKCKSQLGYYLSQAAQLSFSSKYSGLNVSCAVQIFIQRSGCPSDVSQTRQYALMCLLLLGGPRRIEFML